MAGSQNNTVGSVTAQLPQNLLRPADFPSLPIFQGLRFIGDQVMFCRRADFERCGGFRQRPSILGRATCVLSWCGGGEFAW